MAYFFSHFIKDLTVEFVLQISENKGCIAGSHFRSHRSTFLLKEYFLNYLPRRVPESTILVSFDVTSLYTNINHELGVKAMEYWINKHPRSLNSRFSKEFIIDSILLILTNNTFTFDDRIFLQKKGTAMGTKMAPSYATLVLGYLENELYSQVFNKMGEEIGHYVYTNWRRFLMTAT